MIQSFEWADIAQILAALRWTLALSVLAFEAGVVVTLARISRRAIVRASAGAYVRLFQGLPLMILLLLEFLGHPRCSAST